MRFRKQPVKSKEALEAIVPIRAACPVMARIVLHFTVSHNSTSPFVVPTAKCCPLKNMLYNVISLLASSYFSNPTDRRY
jgi:hypothetical protein